MDKVTRHLKSLGDFTDVQIEFFIDWMRELDRCYEINGLTILYVRVTDDILDKISKSAWYLRHNIYKLAKGDGDNIHIFCIIGKGNLVRELRVAKMRYKSISWWNRDLTKFRRY